MNSFAELHHSLERRIVFLVCGIFMIAMSVLAFMIVEESPIVRHFAVYIGVIGLAGFLRSAWWTIKPPTLVLNSEGFRSPGFEKGRLIHWNETGPLELSKKSPFHSRRSILFDLLSETALNRKQLNDLAFKGHTHSIPTDFGVTPEEQLSLMNVLRTAALSSDCEERHS